MRPLMYVNMHAHTGLHGLLCHEILKWVSVREIASLLFPRAGLGGLGEGNNGWPLPGFKRWIIQSALGPTQDSS